MTTNKMEAELARLRARVAELEGMEAEHRRIEAALRDSEERFRALYEDNPSMYFTVDEAGKVLSVNRFGAEHLGYRVGELVGHSVLRVFHSDDHRAARGHLEDCVGSPGQVFQWKLRKVRGDGRCIWVREFARAIRGGDGRIVVLIVCEDITEREQAADDLRRTRDEMEERVHRRTTELSNMVRILEDQVSERRRAEQALEKQRAFLRQVIDVDPNFIFAKDRDGRFTLVNQAVADAYGTSVDGLLGKTDADFNPSAEEVEFFLRMDREVMDTREERFIPEEAITDSTGKVRWLQTVKRPLVDEGGVAGQVLGSATDITARKEAEEKLRRSEAALRLSQAELRALAGKLLSAQEEERRRLAREMHDDLTQRLAVVAIEAGKLEQQLASAGQDIPEKLRDIKLQMVKLSDDVHSISRQLHPSILHDLGLVDALESECSSFARREGIPVEFRAVKLPQALPWETSLSLYRIAQEALRNVAKHAEARGAEVTLEPEDGWVLLTIRDRGRGFDPRRTSENRGLGLASMEERARLVGARFRIDSESGKGTTVQVRAPLPRAS
jgi:PAS domain S-box-containing protein